MVRGLLIMVLVLTYSVGLSQSGDSFGLLPSLNVNKKLPRDWSINFKSEFRQTIYEGSYDYEYVRTDLSLLLGKKVGIYASVAGGYQRIVEEGGYRDRYIQQFNLITPARSLTLGHRFSSDQTFGSTQETEIRFRYRLSSEIPLNGRSLDPGELYLKASNEYVNDFRSGEYDLEIRILGFLGYKMTPNMKLEIGTDYRLDRFIQAPTRNRAWIGFNLFISV